MSIKKGDTVYLRYADLRRPAIKAETVTAVGPRWISVGREKFDAEACPNGSHYGEFGLFLWPDLLTMRRHDWIAKHARAIAEAAQRSRDPDALAKVAALLGVEVEPVPTEADA